MKLCIFLFLLALLLPLGAQLRTHYQPLPAVVKRWSKAVVFPRLAVRVEVIRI
jgi:hypothetical protein